MGSIRFETIPIQEVGFEDPMAAQPTSTVILSFITAADANLPNLNTTLPWNSTDVVDGEAESSLFSMILKSVAMGFVMLMALFGNALVIASVIRIRRLRTITNYFVVSLAVADFLVAALVMPFNALQEILKRWIFPEWVCYFFNSNDVLFCTASVLNLCMVAVDRYVAIVKPLRYHQVMTKRSAALMIASAWTAGLAISYVPIHLNWHLPNFEATPITDYCDFKPSAVYSLASSAVSFWLPTFVILFVYGRIYHIAVNQAKEMAKLDKHMATVYSNAIIHQHSSNVASKQSSISSGSGVPGGGPVSPTSSSAANGGERMTPSHRHSAQTRRLPTLSESSALPRSHSMVTGAQNSLQPSSGSIGSHYSLTTTQSQKKAASRSSESRATKVLAIVIGCYLLCWMPFFLWLNIMATCKNCPDSGILGTILFWIGYSNSTLNPVIYAFFSRDFRNAFIASLRIDKWKITRSFFSKLDDKAKKVDKSPIPASRSMPRIHSRMDNNRETSSSSPHQYVRRHQATLSKRQMDLDRSAPSADGGTIEEVKKPLVETPSVIVSSEDGTTTDVVVQVKPKVVFCDPAVVDNVQGTEPEDNAQTSGYIENGKPVLTFLDAVAVEFDPSDRHSEGDDEEYSRKLLESHEN